MNDRERIVELFAAFGPVAVKSMFGGLGVRADGLFFAFVIGDEVYLKTDAATRPLFEAAGSAPFVYRGGAKPVTMSYWRLPTEALDDDEVLRHWARLAVETARRANAEKAARPGKKTLAPAKRAPSVKKG
jgi:DNA transformation protein